MVGWYHKTLAASKLTVLFLEMLKFSLKKFEVQNFVKDTKESF
jgi:hypothetical protein